MDRMLRAEIVGACKEVMREHYEMYNEVCVSGKELGKHISIFSEAWLKKYGHLLPRTNVVVTDPDGTEHHSSWSYPLHKIQRMMFNDELKILKA